MRQVFYYNSTLGRHKINPYFTYSELMCRCGKCNILIIDWEAVNALLYTRIEYAEPITLNCAYRCVPHNFAVSGKTESKHLVGRAFDLALPADQEKQNKLIKTVAKYFDYWYVGQGKITQFLHMQLNLK